jgi:hypothetical protein
MSASSRSVFNAHYFFFRPFFSFMVGSDMVSTLPTHWPAARCNVVRDLRPHSSGMCIGRRMCSGHLLQGISVDIRLAIQFPRFIPLHRGRDWRHNFLVIQKISTSSSRGKLSSIEGGPCFLFFRIDPFGWETCLQKTLLPSWCGWRASSRSEIDGVTVD